jgi:hypothetical protein
MLGVLGDLVEIRVDNMAEHSERDGGLALKKRAAKFLLQRDDGIGQRGLGNAAALSRMAMSSISSRKVKSSPPAPAARLLQPSTPLCGCGPIALFIAPDFFFTARRVQLVHLAEEPRGDRRVDRRDRWFPARHLFKVWDRSA